MFGFEILRNMPFFASFGQVFGSVSEKNFHAYDLATLKRFLGFDCLQGL